MYVFIDRKLDFGPSEKCLSLDRKRYLKKVGLLLSKYKIGKT